MNQNRIMITDIKYRIIKANNEKFLNHLCENYLNTEEHCEVFCIYGELFEFGCGRNFVRHFGDCQLMQDWMNKEGIEIELDKSWALSAIKHYENQINYLKSVYHVSDKEIEEYNNRIKGNTGGMF